MVNFLRWILRLAPDKLYISCVFFKHMRKFPNLKNPKTFNEKLQWLKLHDRNPWYTKLVDKYEVKEYIAQTIGEEYVIPTLGVWGRAEDIDFDSLPNKFVLKCNHDSGSVIICRDNAHFNKEDALQRLKMGLKTNGFWYGREWPYKNVEPRIIAERLLEDQSGELPDYKIMCFNGEAKCTFVCSDRLSEAGLHVTIFDRNWEIMPVKRHNPVKKEGFERPSNYEKMLELAEKLAANIPFVRVDFYEANGKLYFGEITLYPGSGFKTFDPEEWDEIFGSWLRLF